MQTPRLTTAEYHKRPEMSCSRLKVMYQSPREFYAKFIAKTMDIAPSDEMERGTVLHETILQPSKEPTYVIPPKEALSKSGQRRGKAYEEWEQSQAGKIILTPSDIELIYGMKEAIAKHPGANGFIHEMPGDNETPIFWEADGFPLRSMPDRLCDNWVVDIKTTRWIGKWKFAREATQLLYWFQAGMYLDAARYADGRERDFAIVAVENKPPFRVAIYEFDRDFIDHGRRAYRDAISRYRECMETGDWRDDVEKEPNVLSLPDYLGTVQLTGFDEEGEN